MNKVHPNIGASRDEWFTWAVVNGPQHLFPVVARLDAAISASSKVKKLGKVPSEYNETGFVRGIRGWSSKLTSWADVERWMEFSDYGIFISTREIRAIDFDIDDAEGANRIQELANQVLGIALPVRTRPNSSRVLMIVTVEEPVRKQTIGTPRGNIDILGDGGGFVASSTHPSGAQYEWSYQGKVGIPIDIPVVSKELFDLLLDRIMLEFSGTSNHLGPIDQLEPEERDRRSLAISSGTLPRLKDALDYLASEGYGGSYTQWMPIGAALSTLPDPRVGYSLFLEFSRRLPNYLNDDDVKAHWDVFKADRTAFPSIFNKAKDKGWPDNLSRAIDQDFDDHGPEEPLPLTSTIATANSLDVGEVEGLDEPMDLFGTTREHVARFVATDYPSVIAEFANDVSARVGCDPLLPAWTALVACGAAIPDHHRIQVKAHDTSWTEDPRLWAAMLGEPSTKKTPGMRDALAPFKRVQAKWARDYRDELKAWKKRQKDEGSDYEHQEPPFQRRILINDATIEAVCQVLESNVLGILSVQDELSGFFGAMDAYRPSGAAKDRAFWLQAYTGGPYQVDRVKESKHVENLSVSIIGGIQPEPMRATASKLGDDGLLQRFIVLPVRRATVGEDRPCNLEAMRRYEELVEMLLERRLNDALLFPWPDRFRLSADAQFAIDGCRRRLSGLADQPGNGSRLSAALVKCEGQLMRLVLIFHILEEFSLTDKKLDLCPSETVPLGVVEKAVSVITQLIVPATFDFYERIIGRDEVNQEVRTLAGAILANDLKEVGERDVYRLVRSIRPDEKRRIQELMSSLELADWVIPINPAKAGTALKRWSVNPKVHRKFEELAVRERERRAALHQSIKEASASRHGRG